MKTRVKVGDRFPSKQALKNALVLFCAEEGSNFVTWKSDKSILTVLCSEHAAGGCKWRIHARCEDSGEWSVRTFVETHSCVPRKKARQSFGYKEIKDLFVHKVRESPSYSVRAMKTDLAREYGIQCSYHVCYRAREELLRDVNRDAIVNLSLLKNFLDVFAKKNAGSSILTNPPLAQASTLLHQVFVASAASVNAMQFLRPVIGLESVAMNSYWKGELLAAVAVDAIGRTVPLCYAWVPSGEDKWLWFLECMRSTFSSNALGWGDVSFVSDRQRGLVDALSTVFPEAHHAMCLKHLVDTVTTRLPNGAQVAGLIWQLAKSKSATQYRSALDELRAVSQETASYIAEVEPKNFVDAYFSGKRFGFYTASLADHMDELQTTNSSNGPPIVTIWEQRDRLPMQAIQGLLRNDAALFIDRRKQIGQQESPIPAELAKDIRNDLTQCRKTFQLSQTGELHFEFQGDHQTFVVDLQQLTCTCCGFQTRLFPCMHAVMAIHTLNLPYEAFMAKAYLMEALQNTYSRDTLMVGSDELEAVEIPAEEQKALERVERRRPVGRPKKAKLPTDPSEKAKRALKCKTCGQVGHNRRTCTPSQQVVVTDSPVMAADPNQVLAQPANAEVLTELPTKTDAVGVVAHEEPTPMVES